VSTSLSPDLSPGWGERARWLTSRHLRRSTRHRATAGRRLRRSETWFQLDGRPPGRRLHRPWGRTGGSGPGDGGRTVDGRRSLCTAVEMSTCRQQEGPATPTAGQHPRSRADLRRRVVSPASTPVMTRMKERDRGVLEQHSGWGRAVPAPSGCPSFLRQQGSEQPSGTTGVSRCHRRTARWAATGARDDVRALAEDRGGSP
jgi:hypothetical protein